MVRSASTPTATAAAMATMMWAMVIVLAMSVALRVMLGIDASLVSWVTLFGVILFAVLTGLHLVGAWRR